MQDYERYITVQEAAKRLGRPDPEILRMLETGALPAMLRAELASKDGTPIGFDFARLPPEGVARVVDQGGDDFTLEWQYCGGHGKAVCFRARESSIRVLWEPSLFPELLPQSKDASQAGPGVEAESTHPVGRPVPVVENANVDVTTDPERRLARLRALRGDVKYKSGEWKFRGITALVAAEKEEGRKRSSEKTIRADLKEAAEREREAKRAGPFQGWGQR